MADKIRYGRVYIKLIDDTFYKVLKNEKLKPEIVRVSLGTPIEDILKSVNTGETGSPIGRVYTHYEREFNDHETDSTIIARAIETGTKLAAVLQKDVFK